MEKKIVLFFIFIFFSLAFADFSSAVAYGSGAYGQGTSCVGSAVSVPATPAAGTFSGGGGVIEKYIYRGWEVIFEFNNITYTISLEDVVGNRTAVIKISGGNKNWDFNLDVSQTKKIDLNEDDIYDLKIYISNISGDKIYITANSIQEEIYPKERIEEITGKPLLSLLVFTIIVLLFIIIILIKIIARKSSGREMIEKEYRKKKKKTEREIRKAEPRKKLKQEKAQKERVEKIAPLNRKMKEKKARFEEKHRKRMIEEIRKRKIRKE